LSGKPGYTAIPTLKIITVVNVTKPEETTTKVIEKDMDSIKSVIQDTMQTIHENIDKVQSNVHGNYNTENYYGSPIADLARFLVA
jgi:hypothetical protein